MHRLSREALALHFRALVNIERGEIFGPADAAYRPINLPEDSATMFAGFVGPNCESGNCLILAINPGGGGDAYTERTNEDEHFYPLLQGFKASTDHEVLTTFEAINTAFMPIVQKWNLWRILGPTLEATRQSVDQVTYMNVVPYRTREDKTPPVAAQRIAWGRIVAPTIALLQPRALIALGKKADKLVRRWHTGSESYFCVPRTIGDTYVSAEAEQVLARIRSEFPAVVEGR